MSTPNPAEFNLQDHTILVVDDNPTNLGVIVNYLEDCGFRLLVARDGETGLKSAQNAKPDLILLDVMMPGINGFETCRRLKEDETIADIPVIFMTALAETEDKIRGFQVGGVDYVTKPIQQEER
jgi:two-component system, NtrC family, sensor kinase